MVWRPDRSDHRHGRRLRARHAIGPAIADSQLPGRLSASLQSTPHSWQPPRCGAAADWSGPSMSM
jgi:hypothetical protein